MLSFMLFCVGLMELYSTRNWDKRAETKKESQRIREIFKNPETSSEEKLAAINNSDIRWPLYRSVFEVFVMLCAALFAFKAAFWYMLPIWVLGMGSALSPFRWTEHKVLFVLDNVFCAALFFMAAWAVA